MTSKVVNFIKQYFFMVALAATFVGFSAFKYVENFAPTDGWYALELKPNGQPNDDADWEIKARIGDNPGEGCSTNGIYERCAVELTFDATATSVPSNLDQAYEDEDDNLLSVGPIAQREE